MPEKSGRGRPSRTEEVADKVEDHLKTHVKGFPYRALAKEIEERPSSVHDALKLCKSRGTVVLDSFVGGWCHAIHHKELRRDKVRLDAFRKLSTTKTEDRLAVHFEDLLGKLEETEFIALVREETGKDMEGLAEAIFREFEEEGDFREEIHRIAAGLGSPLSPEDLEEALRATQDIERWRRKPGG